MGGLADLCSRLVGFAVSVGLIVAYVDVWSFALQHLIILAAGCYAGAYASDHFL